MGKENTTLTPPPVVAPATATAVARRKPPVAPASVAPPTPALPVNAGGRARGTSNYSMQELMYLLRIIERIVPVDGDEWQQVCKEHTAANPGCTVRLWVT